jgi:uncharacterized membrane protein YecN with MAPEG domain
MAAGAHIAAIITVLALLFYIFTLGRTGYMRAKHKIMAPAVIGHPAFECAYRIQMNTVESLVAFLPLLWISALFFDAYIAGIIGIIWLIGRIVYWIGYTANPTKRGPGAAITMLAVIALLICSILGLAGVTI